MNVDELYNHIVSQITPEEALKKMLESSLLTYEKLKFKKGKEVHPLFIISMAAMDLGWQIAIKKDKENIEGLTVGTKDYMNRQFKS